MSEMHTWQKTDTLPLSSFT